MNRIIFLHNFKQVHTFFSECISVFQVYWHWEYDKKNSGDKHIKSISKIYVTALCILAIR